MVDYFECIVRNIFIIMQILGTFIFHLHEKSMFFVCCLFNLLTGFIFVYVKKIEIQRYVYKREKRIFKCFFLSEWVVIVK